MRRGTLDVTMGSLPAAIDVYEDGLVFVPGSKNAQVGIAFGAIGALIASSAAKRGLAKKRAQLEELAPASAAAAASVEGCEVVRPEDVRSVEIKKALFGSGRRLIIDRSTGRKLLLAYNSKKRPTAEVEQLLRSVVGDRLQVGPGA